MTDSNSVTIARAAGRHVESSASGATMEAMMPCLAGGWPGKPADSVGDLTSDTLHPALFHSPFWGSPVSRKIVLP
ncbi:MAG: hypothetical protein ACKOPO_03750 [Novosphingobium sp.]